MILTAALRPTPPTIAARLRAHLAGDGTPNDFDTDALYREAKGLPDDFETDLESVERWAFDTINSKGGAA